VNAEFAAAFGGAPEALGMGGIVHGGAVHAVEEEDQIAGDAAFGGGAGLEAFAGDANAIDTEEPGELLGGEPGRGVAAGAGLGAAGEEALVPGGIAKENAIGLKAAGIGGGEHLGQDIGI